MSLKGSNMNSPALKCRVKTHKKGDASDKQNLKINNFYASQFTERQLHINH